MAVSTASVGLQRLDVGRDDRLGDQRAHGVVQQHVALLRRRARPGRRRGVVAGAGPLEDLADLVVAAAADDGPHLVEVARRHHHDDLVDQRGGLHGRDGVLDDRLARDLDQLLGDAQPDPGPVPPARTTATLRRGVTGLTLCRAAPASLAATRADGRLAVRRPGPAACGWMHGTFLDLPTKDRPVTSPFKTAAVRYVKPLVGPTRWAR